MPEVVTTIAELRQRVAAARETRPPRGQFGRACVARRARSDHGRPARRAPRSWCARRATSAASSSSRSSSTRSSSVRARTSTGTRAPSTPIVAAARRARGPRLRADGRRDVSRRRRRDARHGGLGRRASTRAHRVRATSTGCSPSSRSCSTSCAPDVAVFGQKDAQQVHLVGRMVRDLDLPVTIAVVDTVRESDGLALSSRNRYLDPTERAAAVALSRALAAGCGHGRCGHGCCARRRTRRHRRRASR